MLTLIDVDGEEHELPADGAHVDAAALAERRVAAWLQARGRTEAASAHLARAVELAPRDWTVRRGGIELTGGDPFLGEELLASWEAWGSSGRPGDGST